MITLAKRTPGIEEVIAGMKPQRMEETKPIKVNSPDASKIIELLQKYVSAYHKKWRGLQVPTKVAVRDITDILTPQEIDSFLTATLSCENDPLRYQEFTAAFVTKLIQNSYNASNNGFLLHIPTPLFQLCENLAGVSDKVLEVQTIGHPGSFFANFSKYCSYTVGTVDQFCGQYAKFCQFTIDEIRFVYQEISDDFARHADTCEFRTANPKTLKILMDTLYNNGRVTFIEANGREKIVRDYR